MRACKILSLLVALTLATAPASAQTSKFLPGDTLLIPPATQVDIIDGDDFTTTDETLAVLVGKRYPYWFIDFDLDNDAVDSAKVGNSFFLGSGVANLSLEARDLGLEHNRKLSRMGVDVAKVGRNTQAALEGLASRGVPVLLKFSFQVNDQGGVEPKVRVYNISDDRIRSLNIGFHAVDETGKPVHCTKSGQTHFTVTMNGPINPDDECYFAFVNDPAFFNESASCLEIDSVTVEFMDGESILRDDDLSEIQGVLKSPFMRPGECPS